MDKNEVHSAAVATTSHEPPRPQGSDYLDTIGISVVVNARGRVCLIYDRPFNATPVWVKYLVKPRKIKLIFDNGIEYTINYVMNDKLNKIFLNLEKLFIIRLENNKPVEGFDTTLIKE